MSFKTIAGRSDGVFWWFCALSEDQEKICWIHQNYLVAFKLTNWTYVFLWNKFFIYLLKDNLPSHIFGPLSSKSCVVVVVFVAPPGWHMGFYSKYFIGFLRQVEGNLIIYWTEKHEGRINVPILAGATGFLSTDWCTIRSALFMDLTTLGIIPVWRAYSAHIQTHQMYMHTHTQKLDSTQTYTTHLAPDHIKMWSDTIILD